MVDGCQTIALSPHQLSVSTIVKPSITRRACVQRLNACRRYGGERITLVAKCAAAPNCDPFLLVNRLGALLGPGSALLETCHGRMGTVGGNAFLCRRRQPGHRGAQASAVQGRLAALAIGERLGVVTDIARRAAPLQRQLRHYTHIRPFLNALYRPRNENRVPQAGGVVVCRCEEVTAGQIRRYVELGCQGPNQTKAFGRCGMGLCQGRFCGLTVTEVIAQARGVEPCDVGYYRIRPPIKPVLLGDFVQ
jgi:hypothetical protein